MTRGPIAIGFPIDFYGDTYTNIFVRNDGIVTFNLAVANFPGGGYPSIAPFFGDVDTSNPASGEVHFGQTTYQGRRAFCVDWFTRNAGGGITGVGYSSSQADKLNVFQLLLVSRGDGDFDIIFNYDAITWDKGVGAPCARAGFSAGSEDDEERFELAGSGECGALLDTNLGTGLAKTTNAGVSLPDGRWIFDIQHATPPGGGRMSGLVTDEGGTPLQGAPVSTCLVKNAAGSATTGPCQSTQTTADGMYTFAPLADGTYAAQANAPAGMELQRAVAAPVLVEGTDHVVVPPMVLGEFEELPPGMTLLEPPPGPGLPPNCGQADGDQDAISQIYWQCPTAVEVVACPNGTGTWTLVVTQDKAPGIGTTKTFTGDLVWDSVAGRYKGTIPVMYPNHGSAVLSWTVTCPGGKTVGGHGNAYIDPSGIVVDTNGALISGATTTLFWWNQWAHEFEVVPDGSIIMSPSNRVNPGITGSDGRFAWDTLAGDYFVRAEAPTCRSPQDPGQAYADTDVVTVPPPALDLVITLWCPVSRFSTTVSHALSAKAVTASLSTGAGVCRSARGISLWSVRPGPDRRVAIANSSSTGRAAFTHRGLPHGRYYLRVYATSHSGNAGSSIKCGSARSVPFWV